MNEETRPAQPERPVKTTAQVLVDCLEAEGVDVMRCGSPATTTIVASIASKKVRVPRKKLVKKPNREKRAKKLKKGVAKRAGVWYYT